MVSHFSKTDPCEVPTPSLPARRVLLGTSNHLIWRVFPNGIAVAPDDALLAVGDSRSPMATRQRPTSPSAAPDNQMIYLEGAISGTFWRFKASYPGLIGPEV